MKKLTAGIFAGILTIVTVNAADAAIASKAYVDQKDNANKALITENTTSITNLTKTVNDNKTAADTAIADLKETVDGLTGEGTGSVADQIADALGEIPTGSTVAAELGKKQDKSTADYAMGTAAGGWKALTDTEKGALQSGVTAATVTQVATNATDISGLKAKDTEIEGKIGTVEAGKTVVQMITEVKNVASDNVDEKLGNLGEGNTTVADALAKKQDTLGVTNVTTTGNGNAIVSISAADGVVTATRGAVIPEVTTKGETGTFVLTATVTDAGVTNYMWESIERATAVQAGE